MSSPHEIQAPPMPPTPVSPPAPTPAMAPPPITAVDTAMALPPEPEPLVPTRARIWAEERVYDPDFENSVKTGRVGVGVRNLKGTKLPFEYSVFAEFYKTWKYILRVEIESTLYQKGDISVELFVVTSSEDASGERKVKESAFRNFEKGKTTEMFTELKTNQFTECPDKAHFYETSFVGLMMNFCSDAEAVMYRFRMRVLSHGKPALDVLSGPFRVYGRARVHHYATAKARREGKVVVQTPRKRRRVSAGGSAEDLQGVEDESKQHGHIELPDFAAALPVREGEESVEERWVFFQCYDALRRLSYPAWERVLAQLNDVARNGQEKGVPPDAVVVPGVTLASAGEAAPIPTVPVPSGPEELDPPADAIPKEGGEAQSPKSGTVSLVVPSAKSAFQAR